MGLLDKLTSTVGRASSTLNNIGQSASSIIPNPTTGLNIADNGIVREPILSALDDILKAYRIRKTPIMIDLSGAVDYDSVKQSEGAHQFIQLEVIKSTFISDEKSAGKSTKVLNYKEDKKFISSIVLPFPQDIQIVTNPNWNSRSGGLLGDLLLSNKIDLGSVIGLGDNASSDKTSANRDQLASEIFDQATTRAKLQGVDAIGAGIFGTDKASAFLDGASGKLYNPRDIVLFDGIEHRSFDVQFNFAPVTEKQSQDLREFLINIHEYAVPDIYGPYFTYPAFMNFKIVNKENKPILDRGEVVITGLNCNYTPDGVWASFSSGQPIHVVLDVSFKERELPTRKTIKRLFGATE